MNNYDYFYNSNITFRQQLTEKNYIWLNQLKWANYFLIGFNIFHFFLSMFLISDQFSIFISIVVFYISYLYFKLINDEWEIENLNKSLNHVNMIVIIVIGCCIAEVMYYFSSIGNEPSYLAQLLSSDNDYERKFGWFVSYLMLFRIGYLLYIRVISKKLINEELNG